MTAFATTLSARARLSGDAQRYGELVEETFLNEAGWDADRRVLLIPWHHSWLGWRICAVQSCDAPTFGMSCFCSSCMAAWKSSDLAENEFVAGHRRPRSLRVQGCTVMGCPRPWLSANAALCRAHDGTRGRLGLSVEQFVRHELAQPLWDLGRCRVAACPRRADLQQRQVCVAHNTALLRVLRQNPDLDVERWLAQEPAITEYGDVSFGGLRPTVIAQVLYGLQARCASSISTNYSAIRALCDELRRADAATVDAIEPPKSRAARHLWKSTLTGLRRAFASPATEQHKDIWDMAVFGHKGRLLFIDTDDRPRAGRARPDGYGISQPWLRKAVQLWVLEDLPKRRGSGVTGVLQSFVNSMGRLSESLRLQRDDQGLAPAELGRPDIVQFLNRLAYLEGQEQLSARERANICRRIRKVLATLRAWGLTRPGHLLADLPHDFEIRDEDISYGRLPRSEPGRAVPLEILRQLCAALSLLGGPNQENRVAIELMIDTGRRPDEICSLPWDCLERDKEGKYLLVYDNIKCQRRRRELPVTDATAQLIINQQRVIRERYPHTDLATLKLLPSPTRNPHGTQSFDDNSVSDRHRT